MPTSLIMDIVLGVTLGVTTGISEITVTEDFVSLSADKIVL